MYAHDWLVGRRGGELVLDRIVQQFGPAPLYTLVTNRRPLTEAIDSCDVRPSWLQRLPGATGALRRWMLPLMPAAVGSLEVAPCDLVISTSSAVMKSIRPPAHVPHLCYCHSPARYFWEQTDDYRAGSGGRLRAMGLNAWRPWFQRWDRRTAGRVTRFLANSRHTAARIQRAYGREAAVVHPPVRTDYFTVDPSVTRESWYLVVAALEPYKRTHLVVEAANRHGFSLKVVGTGSQEAALRQLAGPTVEMLGGVSDEEVLNLYRRARALIFPQQEDFGIVPVEAQAAGCPVIAFRGGGALDTVTEATGSFFTAPEPDAIRDAVRSFESRQFRSDACRVNAERFSEAAFDRALAWHVRDLLRNHAEHPNRSSNGSAATPRSGCEE